METATATQSHRKSLLRFLRDDLRKMEEMKLAMHRSKDDCSEAIESVQECIDDIMDQISEVESDS